MLQTAQRLEMREMIEEGRPLLFLFHNMTLFQDRNRTSLGLQITGRKNGVRLCSFDISVLLICLPAMSCKKQTAATNSPYGYAVDRFAGCEQELFDAYGVNVELTDRREPRALRLSDYPARALPVASRTAWRHSLLIMGGRPSSSPDFLRSCLGIEA